MLLSEIKEILQDCQQEQLLDFWEELRTEEQEEFLKQLSTIAFNMQTKYFNGLKPARKNKQNI